MGLICLTFYLIYNRRRDFSMEIEHSKPPARIIAAGGFILQLNTNLWVNAINKFK